MNTEQSISRIAIFDTNPILAQGISSLLSQIAGHDARALTITGPTQISLPVGFAPDIVLIDPAQAQLSATELMTRLSGPGDPVAVVGYVATLDGPLVKTCLAAGFRGFLPKTATLNVLQSAIEAVISGGIYLDASAARLLVPGRIDQHLQSEDILSAREKDVLKSVALGMSMKEIGSAMALSAKTIETYKARASSKLNLQTRHDIVNFAIRKGWVETHA
ncbi:response regulator transcription factor [Neogemmobacter tilapiae]|uniref:DNA-binding response regulator n=1 Tax=Neogemmobacter tilapiae TaxID=875041 RepID=A0A918WL19_9RHOB|nr:response regulator transcription factor [Gemmobacter tilapiae]GHC56624.1 DNA-binding response regulator [Gemmobacter tilapiae]